MTDLSYPEMINEKYFVSPVLYQFVETPDHYFYTKTTSGWAILQLPFYLIAEIWAYIAGYETDGFTHPYRFMMIIGAWFYVILGFYIIRKILLKYFTDYQTLILLILLIFGTNILFTVLRSTGQSNLFAFFALAWLFYRVILVQEKASFKNYFLAGLAWGILTLIRPPDGIFGLLIFLWNVNSFSEIKSRFFWWLRNYKTLLAVILPFTFLILIQVIYYYIATGTIIINSYSNNAGEGLDIFDPYLFEFLFSFRKGWLIYTPLMIFAFAGCFYLIKKSDSGRSIVLLFILFIYIISSWTCWWYGASFSARAAIDMYAICIFLVGYFLFHIQATSTKILVWVFTLMFLFLNLVQTYQMKNGILHHSFMTKPYYFSTFLQLTPPTKEQNKLLYFDHYQATDLGFEKLKENYKVQFEFQNKYEEVAVINDTNNYAPEFFISTKDYIRKSHAWLKVTWFLAEGFDGMEETIFYTAASHKGNAYGWTANSYSHRNIAIDSLSHSISFYYLTPHIRNRKDLLLIGAMNHSAKTLKLVGNKVEILEPIIDYK